MAAIKVANYQNIEGFITTAQNFVLAAADYWYDAALEIVLLNEFDPEIDLLIPFYNAYLAASGTYAGAPASGVSAVGKLQAHILNRARTDANARFTAIDTWLLGTGGRDGDVSTAVTVDQRFADVSAAAGYSIAASNIDT